MRTAHLLRKIFSSFLKNVFAEDGHSIAALEKETKEYMNNITSVKEKENTDTIKIDKTVNSHG